MSTDRAVRTRSPWSSEWIEYIIEKYFGQCGLTEDALRQLDELPEQLALRLGKDIGFWREVLSDPGSKLNSLNLIDGAIEKVVNQARGNEKRFGKSICHYLLEALIGEHMANYIAGYIKSMLEGNYDGLLKPR